MSETFVYDIIKLRLKKHKIYFRKPIPLNNHEKALIGIIASYEGKIDYSELGSILGFAIVDDTNRNIRKDKAEIEIFDAYLNNLKNYHLIEYDKELIKLTNWGFLALKEEIKFGFYIGYTQIHEFFDINCDDNSSLPFWQIGVPAIISDLTQTKQIWTFETDNETIKNELQFFKINKKTDEEIFIDNIEQTSVFTSRFVELKFNLKSEKLIPYFENEKIEFLEDLLNSQNNISKKKEIQQKIDLKTYLEISEEIDVNNLEQFLEIIDWEIIFNSGKLKWDLVSIFKLVDFKISWIQISENCPIEILINNIEKLKEELDWTIITKRCENSVVFSMIEKYNWDYEILISRISISEFQEYFNKIILLDGIDFELFYKELDEEFIIKNIELLPRITDFLVIQRQEILLKLIPEFKNLQWNWILFSNSSPLSFILENFDSILEYIDNDTILLRVFTEAESISEEILDFLLKNVSPEFDYLINTHTKLQLSYQQIIDLDSNNMIYWGDDRVNGFEVNPNQIWTSEIIFKFIDKWSYSHAIEFISINIRDLDNINLPKEKWNFDILSSNKYLCSDSTFIQENASNLNWVKTLPNLSSESIISNFELLQFTTENNIDKIANILSNRLTLFEIIELSVRHRDKFIPFIELLNWRNLIESSSNESILDFLVKSKKEFELFSNNIHFSKAISLKIPIKTILKTEGIQWDWQVVTKEAIKQELLDEQNIYQYAHLWDWKIIIENIYQPHQLQIENELPEIATLISMSKDEENIKRAWRHITSIYPTHLIWNAINVTIDIDVIKWDWDYLSSSTRIPFSINTLEQYQDKINWEIFSGNNFLNKLFKNDKDIFGSKKSWETHVLKYLSKFKDKWFFDRLSIINNITSNPNIIKQFRDLWDWKILSSEQSQLLLKYNKKTKYLDHEVIQQFIDKIDFDVLSSRKDCNVDLMLIKYFSNERWNWQLLSENPALKFDNKLFFEYFINKDWNWLEISKNKSLEFDNSKLLNLSDKNIDWSFFSSASWLDFKTVLKLKDKPWDWLKISKNQSIDLDIDLLRILAEKKEVNWNSILNSKKLILDKNSLTLFSNLFSKNSVEWLLITKNKNLNIENIENIELIITFKDYFNWDYIIDEFKIDFNKLEILEIFSDKLNWLLLSKNNLFKPKLSILSKYRNQLNWYFITPKLDFSNTDFSNNLVESLGSFIDWTHICTNANFTDSFEFVKKYYSYMDLHKLINNSSIDLTIYNFVKAKIEGDIYSRFVYKLKEKNSPWSGFVYHFTHLTNAVEIIKNKKILSRNLAQIESTNFSDAAGSVVHRRDTAHEFARFYFRPKTPTQFYNECLGKDINYGNYFSKAKGLGLPKCPVPIFFKFDLEEIFSKMGNKCFISNGNLQKNNSKIGTINEMFNKFNFDYVYSTIKSSSINDYMQWSQQEFLVKDYFDFSELNKYEILVMNENDLAQIYKTFENDKEILSKTRIAKFEDDIFMFENKKVNYNLKGKVLSVSTDYEGNGTAKGIFTLNLKSNNYNILKGTPQYASSGSLSFYPSIELEFNDKVCFNLLFKDIATIKEPWEIIKYCNVD